MKVGLSLLRANPAIWPELVVLAEELGYESVWVAEHLVLPTRFDASAYPDGKLPISPASPLFDPIVHLAFLAGLTSELRLGTYIYQLGLRHPFVAARAVTTLDVVSNGRVELGVGAGWLREEWEAAGADFDTRGARLDEALEVCGRLWTEPTVAHDGEFWSFPEVAFEPKPVQQPGPRLHVGGESAPAMRRAVRYGDGWIGMHHDPTTALEPLDRMRRLADKAGREPLELTVAAHPGVDVDVEAWRRTGVDRLIAAPWARSREALDGIRDFSRSVVGL